MRKYSTLGVSILSVFILCSLSYQPIIADTPIENINQVKESKASNLDVDELKELYYKLIEIKSQSNDDCGCYSKEDLPPSKVICDILFISFAFFVTLSTLFIEWFFDIPILFATFYIISELFFNIWYNLDCWIYNYYPNDSVGYTF